MQAYNEVFSVGSRFEKEPVFYTHPLMDGSHFSMTDVKSAKARRDMFAPSFSKASIRKCESRLRETIWKFIQIMQDHAKNKQSVDLTRGYHSLTTDLIMNFGWKSPMNALDYPDFTFPSVVNMDQFFVSMVVINTFPVLLSGLVRLVFQYPILSKLSPMLSSAFYLRDVRESS